MENETTKRQYFSDVIGEEYKTWKKGDIIFADAPTGCGKTYFILHILLPYVHSVNGRIVYLVNRHSLKQQIENEISKLNESTENFEIYNSHIVVDTYQNFEKLLQNNVDPYNFRYTYNVIHPTKHYIICDEAHYFYCDSLFNTNTYLSFYAVNSMRSISTLIYLSATLNNFKQDLENKIKTVISDLSHQLLLCTPKNAKNITSTNNHSNDSEVLIKAYSSNSYYSNINLEIIHNIDDISKKIYTLPKDEKFVIFTDNIKTGKLIKKELDSKLKFSIPFHISKYHPLFNTEDELKELLNTSEFKEQGIIATAALDNGINLKNYKIQHMFILLTDYEEFMQMLGRKRFVEDELLNLYILYKGRDYYSHKENYYRKLLKIYSSSICFNDSQIINKLLDRNVNDFYLTFTFQYYIALASLKNELKTPNNLYLQYNSFSIFRIKNLLQYYTRLHQEYKDSQKDPFVNHVCEWLNIKPCDVREYKAANLFTTIDDILNLNKDILINTTLTTNTLSTYFIDYKKDINHYLNTKIKSDGNITVSKFKECLDHNDSTSKYHADFVNQGNEKIIISLKNPVQNNE